MEAAVLQRRGFISDGRPLVQRPGEAIHQQLAREKLRGERMPQVITIDGMGDSGFARLGALHGVAHWRRKDPADAAGFAQRQQAAEVVLMQAGARGVMHQHPLRLRQRLQAREHGIGALGAAIHDGNLRVLRQR